MQVVFVTASVPEAVVVGEKVNVLDFGAKGDGTTDDTAAFQKAANYGASAGKPVYVPLGSYVLSGTVTLKNVALVGEYMGSFSADNCRMPEFLVSNPDAAAFSLDNATLSGVRIACAYADAGTAKEAVENIAINGHNCRVYNVKTTGSGAGLRVQKAGVTGLEVVNFFMVNPYAIGLDIGNTKGTVLLENIEMWAATNQEHFLNGGGLGIRLQNNEKVTMNATAVFAAAVAYEIKGKNAIVMNNCCADFSSTALRVTGDSTVTVTGGTYWAHFTALEVNAAGATVSVTGTDMRGNGAAVVQLTAAKEVLVANSNLRRVLSGHNVSAATVQSAVDKAVFRGCNLAVCNGTTSSAQPVIACASGGDVTITACVLQSENPDTALSGLPGSVKNTNNVIGTYVP